MTQTPAPRRGRAGDHTGTQRVLNLLPSRGIETDWTADDALDGGLLTAKAPPRELDLRATWWKVGDQGATGSCVGWAAADGVGRYVMTTAGRITTAQRLSPRHVWMSSKETDEFTDRPTSFVEEAGTSLKAAMDVARKYGYARERDVPFTVAQTMYAGSENAFYAACSRRRISYVNLAQNLKRWKSWLSQNGPIMAGLLVDDNWMMYDGTAPLTTFAPETVVGGHAVTIVGYRSDGTFIVRNSWGTSWGKKGFALVTPAYLAAAFYSESYGAVVA